MPVYYLKYRPQKVSELDSVLVRKFLTNVLSRKTLPHAFLFAGPRGGGKTSAARILAKVINCQKKTPKSIEPCNKCDACLGITSGSFLDLIEIDGASNRGIDEIRQLRERIKLAPTFGKYKVYVIDEVHMLTTEAFNALLKTLEEPPTHAIFVLCTTQPGKLPETIISRCLRLNFRKGTIPEVVGSLVRVTRGEGLKVPKNVLEEIAKNCDGSFRDAQKILEQLVIEGQPYTVEKVKQVLDLTQDAYVGEFLNLLASKKIKEGLSWIDGFTQKRGNLRVLTTEILETLRKALLAKFGLVEEDKIILENLKLETGEIKTLIDLFTKAATDLRSADIPQLPLELAVVEWGERKDGNEKLEPKNKKKESSSQNPSNHPEPHVVQGQPQSSPSIPFKIVQSKWADVLAKIRPRNHSVSALLRGCQPKGFDGKFLTIETFYQFHHERLQGGKIRKLVEEVVGEVLGIPTRIHCVLGERPSPERKKPNKRRNSELVKVAEKIFGVKAKN
jgi:DNA polymerase-3 subunit gamma/tau